MLLLNNGMSDIYVNRNRDSNPGVVWFEAIVRVVLQHFPNALIIALVDGIPEFVRNGDSYPPNVIERYVTAQDHYNVTRVDFARMSRLLRFSVEKNYSTLRQQYRNSSMLWPQVNSLMYANGTVLEDEFSGVRRNGLPLYWANYTPRVEKTKRAFYPKNHPPWCTHQYVCDSILYTLLRALKTGLDCDGSMMQRRIAAKPALPETTVAEKAEVERCLICLKPRYQLNARVLNVIENGTNNSGELSARESPVVVTCGDWKWVTDERKRSGWQSDQAGSLIRFRLKVGEVPTFSITFMKSWQTFGRFYVSFRPISKSEVSSQPLMGCSDVAKFSVAKGAIIASKNGTHVPSIQLKGMRQQFSLWDTSIFSCKLDSDDDSINDVMKNTVVDKMGEANDTEYVDMYVLNSNYLGDRKRVKIQSVTSC